MVGTDATTAAERERLFSKIEPLAERGFDVTYVILAKGPPVSIKKSSASGTHLEVFGAGGATKLGALLRAAAAVWHIARTRPLAVVTSQDAVYSGLLGYLAARLSGAAFVAQLHGDYVDNPLWLKQSRLRPIETLLARWVLRRADSVRVVSERLASATREIVGQRADIESVPIGTNLDVFAPAPEGTPHDSILFVGRLIDEKNPLLFCDAAGAVALKQPNLRIRVAGEGPLKQAMSSRFAATGVSSRVDFLGHLGAADLRAEYARSVAYVHTALWEGWGMPMVEALACGCPVVTTDTGCAGEAVIDGENGFVVAARVEDFSEVIERLARDGELRARMGRRAASDVKRWSAGSLATRFAAMLERASLQKRAAHEPQP
jgi:glycosyltransferase involved in cell wall biosynthesis